MGWAARAKTGVHHRQQNDQKREMNRTRTRLLLLKARIAKGKPLSSADQWIIAHAGPTTLAWLGYERQVTL